MWNKRLLLALWVAVWACATLCAQGALSISAAAAEERSLQWADSVMRHLSLKERIGQLFIYTIAPQRTKANRELLRKVVEYYKVGGLLFSGGMLQDQALLMNEAQRMADVPLMMTFDGEWGLAMRLKGMPSFPKNGVLGCIRNDSLLYEYGKEVARQCRELGVQVNFAPVADVNINPANPVINVRSFGDDPYNVARKVVAYARGLEVGGVLAVCKHFPGHGDTDTDSHHALPRLSFSRARLDSVELYPFRQAITAGVGGIMVGHLEVPALKGEGHPASLSQPVIGDLLRNELGFRGLVFTDALAMKGVSGYTPLCLKALQAGNDLLLVPRRLKEEVEALTEAVKKGEITEETINEKCRRVLAFKYALGLSVKPHVRLAGLESRIRTAQTDRLIQRLNQAAVTVLGNRTRTLPLDPAVSKVAVLEVGESASMAPFVDELSGFIAPDFFRIEKNLPEAQCRQLRDSLAGYKRLLVCVTEKKLAPYRDFLARYLPDVPVIYLCFVPGKEVSQLHWGLPTAAATVLAHSTDEPIQRHTARLLYGKASADGLLATSIGGCYASGEGIVLTPQGKRHYLPEDVGMDARLLARIDTIAREAIQAKACPGCQVVVLKEGAEVYNKAFGTHTWDDGQPVQTTDIYDLASLSKTTGTLLAVMKLYDRGELNLTDRVSDYLPQLKESDKKNITVRDLLLHESGLPPTILFYQEAIDAESYAGALFRGKADRAHSVRIAAQTWANPNFRFREGLTSSVGTEEYTLQVTDSLWLHRSFKQTYLEQIAKAPLGTRRYRYSCVGFILLQMVVEARTGLSMDAFLEREFYRPMGLTRTGYLPLCRLKRSEVVPSAVDGFLRKATLRGYVHDESAAFQGGVSGNAGLFSSASEVARVYQMLLNGGEWEGRRYLSRETCRLFTTTVSKISRRGLGFDKPDVQRPQLSPCAPGTPSAVYGHTGFTGTCAWADPEHNLVYVFLSNRTYPNAWNSKLMQLDIRTRIQEAVYKALK